MKNLPSLSNFSLSISGTIDENIVIKLCEQLPSIQELELKGNLSFFNLDNLVNLKKLILTGIIDEKFNFELFKNLCNQLEDIQISLSNINEKTYRKLFVGYTFPHLVDITLNFLETYVLKKQFINGFPMLKNLSIYDCNISVIDNDSFSNLEQLCFLELSFNQIQFIKKNAFLKLKNLQQVNLFGNYFIQIDPKSIGLRESAILYIENNDLEIKKKST